MQTSLNKSSDICYIIDRLFFLISGVMEDQDELKHRVAELETEHRDLDDVIDRITMDGLFDQLQVQRLKKRKLVLKDQILYLKTRLIPDTIA